jgi:hypothetical protein
VTPNTVTLVADALARGPQAATQRPRVPAQVESAQLAICDAVGVPALLLTDGSVLVLTWEQMRGLRDVFDQWSQWGVK